MKTIEEVIDKMKHYDEMRKNNKNPQFCEGVIHALGWAYNLPYWDMEALNGRKD